MARTPSTTVRLDNLETAVLQQGEALNRIIALLEPKAPAKVTRRAPKARTAARKPRTVTQTRTVTCLCKSTRVAFIAAAKRTGVDFTGMSTKAIAAMCVEDPTLVPAGFAIGEGYRNLFA